MTTHQARKIVATRHGFKSWDEADEKAKTKQLSAMKQEAKEMSRNDLCENCGCPIAAENHFCGECEVMISDDKHNTQ